jgi:two-component system sensor histidine kinase UhpB
MAGEHVRLVIVEDNESDALLTVRAFREVGYDPEWRRVETEAAYIDLLDPPPDAIIADVSLPQFDGLRALRLLKQRQLDVPFILVSGTIDEEFAVAAMKEGASDYLLKDRLGRMGEALARAIEEKRLREVHRATEAALVSAEMKYRTLVERIPGVAYVSGLGMGAQIHYVSPRVESILGIPFDAWIADEDLWPSRIHPDDVDDVRREKNRTCAVGDSLVMEYRVVARDGHFVWIHDEAEVIFDHEAQELRLRGLMIDISERKHAEEELKRSVEMLSQANEVRQRLLSRLVTAQEEERARIAADIHDDSIQKMSAVALWLDMISERHPELAADEYLLDLQARVAACIDGLRHLIFELRPYVLDRDGLAAAMRAYLEAQEKVPGSPEYTVHSDLPSEPPPGVRTVIYRILQEALTNCRKHASASHVEVVLGESDGGFAAAVRDDGIGFDPLPDGGSPDGHLGLTAMGERAEMAGGRLRVESAKGRGTRVELWLPHTVTAPQGAG